MFEAWNKIRMFGFVDRVDKAIWPPQRDSSADVSSVIIIALRIDGLTLEPSALESLYGGHFF